jgi:hypothetical protein
MDEGAAIAGGAICVRVEMKTASAAFGKPVIAGCKVPEATPEPVRGRKIVGEKNLMQRQPRCPAILAGAICSGRRAD